MEIWLVCLEMILDVEDIFFVLYFELVLELLGFCLVVFGIFLLMDWLFIINECIVGINLEESFLYFVFIWNIWMLLRNIIWDVFEIMNIMVL